MSNLKIFWEKNEAISGGKAGKLGKYRVFVVYVDIYGGKNHKSKYKLTSSLPGILNVLGRYSTEEEAIKRAEEVFNIWLENSGILQQIESLNLSFSDRS